MPIIDFQSQNFSGTFAGFNGGGTLNCTWAQIAWAAVTVGKAYGDEFANGIFSTFERMHRASMIYAYLMQAPSGRIIRTVPFATADPTEKGNISYSIGMTLAKLFAEVYFDTPRLLHYATNAQNYNVVTAAGNSRPDLIGLTNSNEWVVFEAKGRSNTLEAGVLEAAKQQSQQIASIDGSTPICRIGSAAYFSSSTALRFALDDPESDENRHTRTIELPADRFLERYNNSLRRLIEVRGEYARETIDGRDYLVSRFEESDLSLGIAEEPLNRHGVQISELAYVGGDGLLVSLGTTWSDERMRLQPQLR